MRRKKCDVPFIACIACVCFVQTYFVAGLGSGVTEAILVNPFEVVKVAQQANK